MMSCAATKCDGFHIFRVFLRTLWCFFIFNSTHYPFFGEVVNFYETDISRFRIVDQRTQHCGHAETAVFRALALCRVRVRIFFVS